MLIIMQRRPLLLSHYRSSAAAPMQNLTMATRAKLWPWNMPRKYYFQADRFSLTAREAALISSNGL